MLAFDSTDTTVGTDAEASAALRGALDTLSSGLFKDVVVNADRTTVYKVIAPKSHENYVISAAREQLVAEAAWCAALTRRGTPGIPPASLYVIDGTQVLAMPFYDGPVPADYRVTADAVRAWNNAGLSDLHGDNYRFAADGTPMVIDLAGWAGGYPADTLPASVLDSMPEYQTVAESVVECEGCDDCNGYDDDYETSYRYITTAPATVCQRRMGSCMGAAGHNGAGLTTRMAAHNAGRGRVVTGGTAPAPMTSGPAPVVLGQLALPGVYTRCYGPMGTVHTRTRIQGVTYGDPRHCAHVTEYAHAHRVAFWMVAA